MKCFSKYRADQSRYVVCPTSWQKTSSSKKKKPLIQLPSLIGKKASDYNVGTIITGYIVKRVRKSGKQSKHKVWRKI